MHAVTTMLQAVGKHTTKLRWLQVGVTHSLTARFCVSPAIRAPVHTDGNHQRRAGWCLPAYIQEVESCLIRNNLITNYR